MSEDVQKGKIEAERRRYPRIPLKIWINYTFRPKGRSQAVDMHLGESVAEDLGTRGISIRSDHLLPVGQVLNLTLFLPPESARNSAEETLIYTEENGLPATVLSRVVWTRPLPEGEYLLGIEFLDAEMKDRHRLKAFLVDYQLDAPDSALFT